MDYLVRPSFPGTVPANAVLQAGRRGGTANVSNYSTNFTECEGQRQSKYEVQHAGQEGDEEVRAGLNEVNRTFRLLSEAHRELLHEH